jgi:hypothetical protein
VLAVNNVVEVLRVLVSTRIRKTMIGFELSRRNALKKEGEQANARIEA